MNTGEPEIFCEIKSHDLSLIRKFEEGFQFFRIWWTGIDRPNRIQYLRLSDIATVPDRNLVLNKLVGCYHLQRYWLQCAANATNKVLIGFYNIIGNYRNSREFILDTIVEVDINEIESYLSTTVKIIIYFELKIAYKIQFISDISYRKML